MKNQRGYSQYTFGLVLLALLVFDVLGAGILAFYYENKDRVEQSVIAPQSR